MDGELERQMAEGYVANARQARESAESLFFRSLLAGKGDENLTARLTHRLTSRGRIAASRGGGPEVTSTGGHIQMMDLRQVGSLIRDL